MSRRRWVNRMVLAVVAFAVLDVTLGWLDFEPDHLRLALVVALVAAISLVVEDNVVDSGLPWTADPERPMLVAGADAHLASYVRMVESHLTAAAPDAALRDRLRALCDERLARRRGLSREDPAARELLGEDLLADLAAPPRRLTRARIDDHLRRIEEL